MRTIMSTDRDFPIHDRATQSPTGQGTTEYELHGRAWWIVSRDSYRRAFKAHGPHRSKKAAIKEQCQSLGY